MEFEWDAEKNHRNIVERGLPFSLAEELFQNPIRERVDDCRNYGEVRIRAYGMIRGRFFVCVYNDRVIDGRDVRWIISLRKANAREVKRYYERIEAEDSG